MKRASLIVALVVASSGAAGAETLAITGAKVHVKPGTTVENATVVVDGGKVVSVVAGGAAPAGARVIDGTGKVVTADAMFCQTQVCQTIQERGGDDLLSVKDNQPDLQATIAATFAESEGLSPLATARLG